MKIKNQKRLNIDKLQVKMWQSIYRYYFMKTFWKLICKKIRKINTKLEMKPQIEQNNA